MNINPLEIVKFFFNKIIDFKNLNLTPKKSFQSNMIWENYYIFKFITNLTHVSFWQIWLFFINYFHLQKLLPQENFGKSWFKYWNRNFAPLRKIKNVVVILFQSLRNIYFGQFLESKVWANTYLFLFSDFIIKIMWMTLDGWILVALGWSPLMDENGLCQWTYMRSLGWKSSSITFSLVDEVCWMKVVDEDKTIIQMNNLRSHCHIPRSTMAR